MTLKASSIDFSKTIDDYVSYRAGFPVQLFQRLKPWGIMKDGQQVLDIGTGTGTLARSFACRGCRVTGLDSSEAMIAAARQLATDEGLSIEHVVAAAERTHLPAGSFDGVTAGQCWHWLDRAKTAREIRRVLRPGGWLLIAQHDWLPLPDNVAEATEQLICKYNPEWDLGGGTGIHPQWLTDVRRDGFGEVETFSFDVTQTYSHRAWRGRIRASSGVGASMARGRVARFDESLRALLQDRFVEDPLQVDHRVWALVCRLPAAVATD